MVRSARFIRFLLIRCRRGDDRPSLGFLDEVVLEKRVVRSKDGMSADARASDGAKRRGNAEEQNAKELFHCFHNFPIFFRQGLRSWKRE